MPTQNQPKLPAANEFTPGQLGGPGALYELFELVQSRHGDRDSIIEAIRLRWFSTSAQDRLDPAERLEQQRKRAANVVSGMRQYGLLEASTDPLMPSQLGAEIASHASEPAVGYDVFVNFLLRERHGFELLEIARSIRSRDGTVSKSAVDVDLIARGYSVSTNSSYSGKLRQWLEIAGVVNEKWEVDDARLVELGGISLDGIGNWRNLTADQQAVIEVLRIRWTGNQEAIPSSELLELLRQRNVDFNPGQVKRQIYGPLAASGWITHEVTSSGRGGKGGLISLTPRALDADIALISGLKLGDIPVELQRELGRPLPEIIADLDSDDTGIKGAALELLSLRIAADAGLLPVELRLRGSQTGGAEVDLVAEMANLHFSRWLFQCKNQTARVGLSVLAKEVGMATLLRAQVVVIVTTSTFARTVRTYARQAAESSAIQIVLLDRNSLAAYRREGPRALRAELRQYALDSLTLKRSQLAAVPSDAEQMDEGE